MQISILLTHSNYSIGLMHFSQLLVTACPDPVIFLPTNPSYSQMKIMGLWVGLVETKSYFKFVGIYFCTTLVPTRPNPVRFSLKTISSDPTQPDPVKFFANRPNPTHPTLVFTDLLNPRSFNTHGSGQGTVTR